MRFETGGPERYAHQKRGLRWLIDTGGVGALLFDPGTGKTAVVIDYAGLLALKSTTGEVRVLVVCPLVAVDTWVMQMEKFASPQVHYWAEALGGSLLQRAEAMAARGGNLHTKSLRTGKPQQFSVGTHPRALHWDKSWAWATSEKDLRQKQGPDAVPTPRIVLEVINIDTLTQRTKVGRQTMADVMVDAIKRFNPELVVVDESHKIKAATGNASRLLARVTKFVKRRVILTGTVMPHALTLSSPILTPSGYKPMGEMQVGDHVIGADGLPTEVIGVWPQGEKPIFTVTFSDGATVDCTEDHLWTVTSRGRRSRGLPPLTLSTADLLKGRTRSRASSQKVGLSDKGGSARWAVPTVRPVELPKRPVPLDPYLMGLLLGDGHLGHSVDFTTADDEIARYAEDALPADLQLTVTPGQHGSPASRYRITSGKKGGSLPGGRRGPAPNAVAVALDGLGLRGLRGPEKFVPEVYLWNDLETRLGVLRGLMDSDGTPSVGSTSKFVTTSPRLAEGVKHLVRSLGGYVTERVEQRQPITMPPGYVSPARPLYVLLFGMPFNPFLVARKAGKWRPRTEQKLRTIVSIEPRDAELAQCITVAAKDGLFVTGDFVVTHNSPLDVFGQWRFLEPYAFGSKQADGTVRQATFNSFKGRFAEMGGWMGKEVKGYHNLDDMQRIMAKNAVVARKKDALDLPPTTDVILPVELSPAEKKAYVDLKTQLATKLSSGELVSVTNRLPLMMRLRQITSGHVPEDGGGMRIVGKSKVETIRSLVHDSLVGEKRIVVFALFTVEIEMLRKALDAPGTEIMVIDGSTPKDDRIRMRKRFGSDSSQRMIMIAQIKTMSLAVNELVTASHAVFASLSQQRDDYIQARDRLDRIGQTSPVTFWHAIAPGTVDEVILKSHRERTNLEDAMLKHIQEGAVGQAPAFDALGLFGGR